MLSLLVLATLAASPVENARAQLKAGQLDEVLFALDGQQLQGADKQAGADVLGDAALAAFKKKDLVLALQFTQMALRLDPKQVAALEAGARASYSAEEFTPAENYADRWLQVQPENPEAHLLRADMAMSAGEWKKALDLLAGVGFDADQAKRAKLMGERASSELNDRADRLSQLAGLQKQLEEAERKAARSGGSRTPTATTARADGEVVLYGTSWCKYCKKAREYLNAKGVRFADKDVEKDAAAQQELIDKAVRAHVQPTGVPVIDVYGTLILGFDKARLDQALARR